jgi:hypothetical protein
MTPCLCTCDAAAASHAAVRGSAAITSAPAGGTDGVTRRSDTPWRAAKRSSAQAAPPAAPPPRASGASEPSAAFAAV